MNNQFVIVILLKLLNNVCHELNNCDKNDGKILFSENGAFWTDIIKADDFLFESSSLYVNLIVFSHSIEEFWRYEFKSSSSMAKLE